MRIFIDDQPCPCSARTAAEALAEAASVAEEQGRIVVEVFLDGERLDEHALAGIESRESVPEDIRIGTSTIGELLRDAFSNAAEVVHEIDAGQRDAAELLQSGLRAEAMHALEAVLDRWTQVGAAVERGLELAGWDPTTLQLSDASLPGSLSELAAALREIRAAMRQQDDVRLADCLLYEMPKTIERWNALLPALGRQASERGRT